MIRLISITLAGLAACSTAYAAAAAPIYAVCTKTASPDLSTYQLYKVPPKTINEVAKDIVMGGIAGMMVEKPDQESYVIKPDLNSRPCKIHPTAQANLFTAFFLAPFAAASAVARIQSCANKGVKKPFRPRRTMALSSQQML